MKRKTAFIETGRNGACIFYERVRILGECKKTGKLWVKGIHQTRLVWHTEVQGA